MAGGPRHQRRQPDQRERHPRRNPVARGGTDGPPYYAAVRLYVWVRERRSWNELDGRARLSGGRGIADLDLKELLNLYYAWIVEYKSQEQREKFDRELEADPGESRRRPDPQLLALMAASRMPQATGPIGSGTWKPGDKR